MNKLKKTDNDAFSKTAIIYVSAIFALHPLFMHKGYFDITEAKVVFYTVVTSAYLISLIMLILCGAKWNFSAPGKAVACLWVYFAIYLISSLVFGYDREVFIAADNRYQGLGMTLLYSLSVYFISGSRIWEDTRSRYLFYSAAAALLISGLFGVINYLGLDPFGLYKHMTAFESRKFFSGIGNVDFISAYFSLFIPSLMFIFISAFNELKKEEKILLAAACTAGIAALPAASSSVFIGLACAVSVFPLLYMKLKGAGFAKAYAIILAVFTGLLLFGLILFNTALKETGGLAGKYLVIDNDWGSDRGKIWAHILGMFKDFTPIKKLIGGGSGCIAGYDKNFRIFPDAVLDSAHNEYLHLLVNSGILGLAAYLGFLGFCIINALKSGNVYKYALVLGIVSYMAQATVNIAQPMTTPLFITAAALLAGDDH